MDLLFLNILFVCIVIFTFAIYKAFKTNLNKKTIKQQNEKILPSTQRKLKGSPRRPK
jgi:hypothetical protein